MKNLIIIALLGLTFNVAYGGIDWKYKEQSIEAQQGQGSVEAAFPFSVTGDESISIISVKTTGSCLTVDSVSGEYKPGTEGVLKIHYTPKDTIVGTIAERVTVETTDPKTPRVDLMLMIYFPLTYRIEPGHLFWKVGGDPNAKDIYFIDINGKGYKPAAIYSSSVNFTATLIPPEGRETRYIIRIKPVSTDKTDGAYVYLDVDMGDGTIEKRGIVAAIRDPNDPTTKMRSR